MALGDNNYNNKNKGDKKTYSPTLYSPYKFSNVEDSIDPSQLSFTYWNNLLKISIAPVINNGDKIAFDHDNNISIYINHTKAKILVDEIRLLLANPDKYHSVGIPSGDKIITVTDGSEFNIKKYCVVIRQLTDDGKVDSSFGYQFKETNYAIRNFILDKGDFDKVNYVNIELEQLLVLLEEYNKAMSGAVSYSVLEGNKYEQARLNNKVEAMMDKLGVKLNNGYSNNSNRGASSYFNNSNSSNTDKFESAEFDDYDN